MKLGRRSLLLAAVAPLAAHAQTDGPAAPIVALNTALRAAMAAGRATPFAIRAAALRPVVERAFDLATILQASVGPRFASFTDAAKATLLEVFTTFTVATWVGNFDVLNGETFEVLPATRKSGTDEIVASRITPRTGEATRLDYVMRQLTQGAGAGGWKAVDILLNGTISRVAVQRSDFRALVAGGDAAPLITSLRDRAAALAAGNRP